jgi:hypothetical protein
MDAARRKDAACQADREALRRYADLAARRLLTPIDSANNIKLANARIARNCPR